jgi:fibrillarin-like pre-rRNA processing protein
MAAIRQSDVPHVYTDGGRLYTRNADPGVAVYGERLVRQGDAEFREWSPRRSKLAAFLKKGAAAFPFQKGTDVLYLGAAQGTTVSHLSDICTEGTIFAVEVSRRAFQALLDLSQRRHNVMPILGDADAPETYERLVGPVEALYQDVAQRDQSGIFLKNLRFLRTGSFGLLFVKARSVDVAADPKTVYARVRRELAKVTTVVQGVELDPFERDHAAFLVEKA